MRRKLLGRPHFEAGALPWAFGAAVALLAALLIAARTGDLLLALAGAMLLIMLPGLVLFGAVRVDVGEDRVYAIALVVALGFMATIIGGVLINALGIALSRASWAVYILGIGAVTEVIGWLRYRRAKSRARQTPVPAAPHVEQAHTDAAVAERGLVDPAGAGDPVVVAGVSAGAALYANADVTVDTAPVPTADPRAVLGGGWRRIDRSRMRRYAMLAVALLIAGTSVSIARAGLAYQSTEQFTQFWMLPGSTAGQFSVGIRNLEGSDQTYRVEVTQNSVVVESLPGITLSSGATFTASVTVPETGRVDASLYRPQAPRTAYRSVSGWVGG